MSKEITLSYIDVPLDLGFQMMRLHPDEYDAKRDALVLKVFENNDVDPQACPPAWRTSALQQWCWLILHINGIEHDPEDPKPLVYYGIDMGFVSKDVNAFVWAIS